MQNWLAGTLLLANVASVVASACVVYALNKVRVTAEKALTESSKRFDDGRKEIDNIVTDLSTVMNNAKQRQLSR